MRRNKLEHLKILRLRKPSSSSFAYFGHKNSSQFAMYLRYGCVTPVSNDYFLPRISKIVSFLKANRFFDGHQDMSEIRLPLAYIELTIEMKNVIRN